MNVLSEGFKPHCTRWTLLLAAIASSSAAAAQTTDVAAPASENEQLEEVTVTGSRIARPDYVASSPLATVDAGDLQATGAVTIERMITDMPQFRPGTTALSNYPPGRGGQSLLNLRGVGTNRSLVLLDGRRLQPSAGNNAIDLNTIPNALVENIEVISGGASAAYGSDAIAGVVNFKLRHDFDGVEINAQSGWTEDGGGDTQDVGVAMGSNFSEGRGNVALALNYAKRDELYYSEREFYDRYGAWPVALSPATGLVNYGPNLPSSAAVNQVFAGYGVAPGTVPAAGSASALGFNPDGTLFAPVGAINYRGPLGDQYFVERGVLIEDHDFDWYAQIPLERYSAFGRAQYEFSDAVTAFAQVNYTTYEATTSLNGLGGNNLFGMAVAAANPFIPGDLRTIMNSRQNPAAPIFLSKGFGDFGPVRERNEYDVYQVIAGLSGRLPVRDWTWEIYGSHGQAEQDTEIKNAISRSRLALVLNDPQGGAGLCTGGYNPFGFHPPSDDCRAFLAPLAVAKTEVDQQVFEANLQGGLLELPAGQLRFAAGTGYRRNSYEFVPDERQLANDLIGSFNSGPGRGSDDVREAYVELLVPLLRDIPLVHELNTNLGYRVSDYGTIGSAGTYKAELDWAVVPSLRFRGGIERAIRAPSPGELYAAASVGSFPITALANGSGGDPCDVRHNARNGASAAEVRALCIAQGVPAAGGLIDNYTFTGTTVLGTNVGNPDLEEETGDTMTVGVVFTSPFENPLLSGLTASLDYYRIEITDIVGGVSVPLALERCFNLEGSNPTYSPTNEYCQLISRNATTGAINTVTSSLQNLGVRDTSGYDLQIDWQWGLGSQKRLGVLSFSTLVSYVEKIDTTDFEGAPVVDYNGTISTGHFPELQALSSLNYLIGPVDLSVRWRYLSDMEPIGCRTGGACSKGVDAIDFFDLTGRWRLSDALELRAGVNDLTDKHAPEFLINGVSQYGRSIDPGGYDILGRRYFLAFTARFD